MKPSSEGALRRAAGRAEPVDFTPQAFPPSDPQGRLFVPEVHAEDLTERTFPMSVANMAFLVERLFADCAPGQFVRELTKNGLQALGAVRKQGGMLLWTIDPYYYEKHGVYKLCVIDSGVGMTGEELVSYINALARSSYVQSTTENFGVGAKISAAPRNQEGMIYLSWKDGKGAMVHLWKNPTTGIYGLRQLKRADGTYGHWAPVSGVFKPEQIDQHGTKVVLLGNDTKEDTTLAPAGVAFPKRWILRYLNGRFFRFPGDADVRVHEGWHLSEGDKHNFLRKVTGLERWLNDSSEASGTVEVTGARVHWWLMRTEVDRNSGHYPTPGLVAALWQDELYDMVTSGRAGFARLQSFGIIFESDRVAIVVEPLSTGGTLTTNTARTTLLLDGQPLPWAEWAAEFRALLPTELQALMEDAGAKSAEGDVRQAIRERLKAIRDLFTFSRYRRMRGGNVNADPNSVVEADDPLDVTIEVAETNPEPRPTTPRRPHTPRAGDLYAAMAAAEADAIEAEPVMVREMPIVHWISRTNGTRSEGQLEDRAAEYLPETNKLLINSDFRVFTDMERRWLEQFKGAPAAETLVKKEVHEWFTQQLIEAVVSAKSLLGSSEWTEEEVRELWSERALTAVVLPRYHIDEKIKRTLNSRLASYRGDAVREGLAAAGQ